MATKQFITGCDRKTEWQLPWFLDNLLANTQWGVTVFDFGMTPDMLKHINQIDRVTIEPLINVFGETAWFLKPMAMVRSNSIYTCWLDTDCEVLSNIDGIWDNIVSNKISMAVDRPWTERRPGTWHNSGVVAFYGCPQILQYWQQRCMETKQRGDQEVLQAMLGHDPLQQLSHIHILPPQYNWLRIDLQDGRDSEDKIVMHWTGLKGDQVIREKINDTKCNTGSR